MIYVFQISRLIDTSDLFSFHASLFCRYKSENSMLILFPRVLVIGFPEGTPKNAFPEGTPLEPE